MGTHGAWGDSCGSPHSGVLLARPREYPWTINVQPYQSMKFRSTQPHLPDSGKPSRSAGTKPTVSRRICAVSLIGQLYIATLVRGQLAGNSLFAMASTETKHMSRLRRTTQNKRLRSLRGVQVPVSCRSQHRRSQSLVSYPSGLTCLASSTWQAHDFIIMALHRVGQALDKW